MTLVCPINLIVTATVPKPAIIMILLLLSDLIYLPKIACRIGLVHFLYRGRGVAQMNHPSIVKYELNGDHYSSCDV